MAMEAEDIHVKLCLQEIVKLDLEVQGLIQDIRQCGNSSALENSQNKKESLALEPNMKHYQDVEPAYIFEDLVFQVDDRLNLLRSKIKELEKLGREQDKEANKVVIVKQTQSHQQALTRTMQTLRKAKLIAQLTIDNKMRELLMSGDSSLRQRKISNKDMLAKAASNITDSLIGLNRMMAGQVKQSENAVNTLVSSSKAMGETHEEFKSMSGHIQNSHKLISKYNLREFTDRLLIILALIFFFSTVLYIIKKRLLL